MKAEEGKEEIFWGQVWVKKDGSKGEFILNNKPGYRGSNAYELNGTPTTLVSTEEELRREFKPITFSLSEKYGI